MALDLILGNGEPLACRLLKAFGVDPGRVRSFSIKFGVDDAVVLSVDYFVDKGQAEAANGVLSEVTTLGAESPYARFCADRLIEMGHAQLVLGEKSETDYLLGREEQKHTCCVCWGACPPGWPHHVRFEGERQISTPYTIEEYEQAVR